MDLAFYDLKLHKGRFIATVIGVGLLFTIVLAMNGLYRGNIHEGLAVIKATNPDLWVVERDRGGPFNEQSTMPEFYHYSVKAIPGVEQASPFIFYTVERQVGARAGISASSATTSSAVWAVPFGSWPAGPSSTPITKWWPAENWESAWGRKYPWVSTPTP